MPEDSTAFEIIYGSLLLIGGLACLVHFAFLLRRPKKIELEESVPAWRIGTLAFMIGGVALVVLVALVLSFVGTLAPAEWILPGTASQILVFGLAMHSTALVVLLVLYKTHPEKFQQPFNRKKLGWGKALAVSLYSFLVLVPVIYPLTFLWNLLLQQFGIDPEQQEAVLVFAQIDSLPFLIAMIVLTVVVAPVSEEFVFRGCLYRFIKARTAIIPSLILTNLLFAALHQNLLSFLPLFILGIALAYAYEKSGDLKVPILLHGIFNLNTVIVIIVTNALI